MIASRRLALRLSLAIGLASPALAQTVWHVDAAAAPAGTGLSWSAAFDSIDAALGVAVLHDSVWVKAGTYLPTVMTNPAEPRTATFSIPEGVALYGGFAGTETSFEQRAGLFAQTILTGDRGVPGDYTDNVFHVVTVTNSGGIPAGPVTVDGFTIRDGKADGLRRGGGLDVFNSLVYLSNCILRDNRAYSGGALTAEPGGVLVRWCEFIDNEAASTGGAIFGRSLSYWISHCTFRGNRADKGGAIFLTSITLAGWRPKVQIGNSLFHDNTAAQGGAVFLGGGDYYSGKALFGNCTFAFNSATVSGGGIVAQQGTPVKAVTYLFNCIVWGNTAPTDPNLRGRMAAAFCDLEGSAHFGGGNLHVDPWFVDPGARDLRLLPGSPCNDAGSNACLVRDFSDVDFDGKYGELVPLDLDGTRRRENDPVAPDTGVGPGWIVDLGAYER